MSVVTVQSTNYKFISRNKEWMQPLGSSPLCSLDCAQHGTARNIDVAVMPSLNSLWSFLITQEISTQNSPWKTKLSECLVDQGQMKAMVTIESLMSSAVLWKNWDDGGMGVNEELWTLTKGEIAPLSLGNLRKKVVNIKQNRKTSEVKFRLQEMKSQVLHGWDYVNGTWWG